MTTGGPRPDDFEQDLQRVAAAWRELPDEVPPDLVDQAVLNRARRAASRKVARPWNFGWIHAVSTTALVVLGIALLMQRPEPTAPEPTAPEPLRISRPPSDDLAAPRRQSPALQVPATAPGESGQKSALARERRQAPAAEGAAARQDEALQAAPMHPKPLADSGTEQAAAESDAANARPAAAAQAPLKQADEPWEAERLSEDPEAWLQRILELQRRGDEQAAAAELAAFRAAWPDYPLPAELAR
jgi:type IV secretory pathway VirB10-like protein